MDVKPPSRKRSAQSDRLRDDLLAGTRGSAARVLGDGERTECIDETACMVGVPGSEGERGYETHAPSGDPRDRSGEFMTLLSESKRAASSHGGAGATPERPDDLRPENED